jgi:hypothetical protein
MRSDVEVNQTAGPDLESNEYIKDLKACRHGDKQVASDSTVRMIAEKGSPALLLASVRSRALPHVLADGARRESNLEFQEEFIRNPLFTPARVFGRHADQRLHSTGAGGLPTDLDFQRQKRRNASRCQLMRVAGLTITKGLRHSKRRASLDKTKRSAAAVALGFFSCSRNTAELFRQE